MSEQVNETSTESTEEVSIDVSELFQEGGVTVTPSPSETKTEEVTSPSEEVAEVPEGDKPTKRMVVDPRMYIYFDLEFTGLTRDSQLISIGLCDAYGHSFYAEFNDFDYGRISPWVFKNVLQRMTNPTTHLTGDHWQMRGNSKEIAKNLLYWLQLIRLNYRCGFQFVGDCCHYDMVFLIDLLWGNAMRMPEWICPVAVDVNVDIANIVLNYNIEAAGEETEGLEEVPFNQYYDAFNLNRDEYAQNIKDAPKGLQHNSMYDAYIIRAIHQNIWKIDLGPIIPLKDFDDFDQENEETKINIETAQEIPDERQ